MIIPELIETAKVARAIGWTTDKTTRFLTRLGVASRVKGYRDTLVCREQFEATMPQIYRLFVTKYESGELSSKRGRRIIRRNKAT